MFELLVTKDGAPLDVLAHGAIAIVGAGGKTTLAYRVVRSALALGHSCVFTTTTHIWQPARDAFHYGLLTPTLPGALDERLPRHGAVSLWLANKMVESDTDDPRHDLDMADRTHMPVTNRKLKGYAPADVDALGAWLRVERPTARLVVEADGARGKAIKAPAHYEPQIPAGCGLVFVLASLDCIGRTADLAAHRPTLVRNLAGLAVSEPIAARHMLTVLAHPQGGMKGIPPQAIKVAVLTSSQPANLGAATEIMAPLLVHVDAVALLAV